MIQKSSITKLLVKTLLLIIIDSDLKIYQRGNTVLCIRVWVLVSSEPWKEPSNHFIVIFYSKAILLNFFQEISGRISDQNLPMLLYREGNHKSGLHFVSGICRYGSQLVSPINSAWRWLLPVFRISDPLGSLFLPILFSVLVYMSNSFRWKSLYIFLKCFY